MNAAESETELRIRALSATAGLAFMIAASARAEPPQFLTLDHVALHVKSLEDSLAWYQSHFGFGVLHTWPGVWMIGRGNIKIGLFLTSPLKPVDDPEHSVVIEHFAFAADGDRFQAIIDQLRLDGIKLTPVEDTGIAYSVFMNDPDNHQIEITTYHGGKQPPK